jgi:hypothetical protein
MRAMEVGLPWPLSVCARSLALALLYLVPGPRASTDLCFRRMSFSEFFEWNDGVLAGWISVTFGMSAPGSHHVVPILDTFPLLVL